MLHAQHSSRCSLRLAAGVALCLLGCSTEAPETPFRQDAEALSRPAFCERADVRKRQTAIDAVFCGEAGPPTIASVRDVQAQLALVPFEHSVYADGLKHTNEVVMVGLSTALPGH